MGKKTKIYKRAKLEKFAHYLMKDGLVTRLSMYQDSESEWGKGNIDGRYQEQLSGGKWWEWKRKRGI